jgi:hypothetical protein
MTKYKAQPTVIDGIRFASKKEGRRYTELKLMERGNLITDLKLQQPIKCMVNGDLVCKYISDFSYYDRDKNEIIWEDAKGYKKGQAYAMFTLKKKLVKACTGIDITEV